MTTGSPASTTLCITVGYASSTQQVLLDCEVPEGTTVRQAVIHAGLEAYIDELTPDDVATMPLGIFSRPVADPDGRQVAEGDRVEGYRPLKCDPKQARRQRAAKRRKV